MMTSYKPLSVCVLFLACLLAIISTTHALQPYAYAQSRYTDDLQEQRVAEMRELAVEMEQAQLATCAKMDFLNNDIVGKMEKLNCPQVQQVVQQQGLMNALAQLRLQQKHKCFSNEVRIGFEETEYSVSRSNIDRNTKVIEVPITVAVLAGSFNRPRDSSVTVTVTLSEGGDNVPVAVLEFSADNQRQTVHVRLPEQDVFEWTVSLFADFRELKNDVILHPRVAKIKFYLHEAFAAAAAEATSECTTSDQPGECVINSEFRSVTNIILQRLEDLECKLDIVVKNIQDCCKPKEDDCCEEDTEIIQLKCCTPPPSIYYFHVGSEQQNAYVSLGTEEYPASSCKQIAERCSDCAVSGYYYIQNSKNQTVKVYCDMEINQQCGGSKGWVRIANVTMTYECHECPGDLVEIKEGDKKLCTRKNRSNNHGCAHAPYNVSSISYSNVCGRVKGYQKEQPDAFMHYWEKKNNETQSIILAIDNDDDSYVDGVSITRINSEKTHIWTFAAAQDETFSSVKHHARQCNCSLGLRLDTNKQKTGIPNDDSVPDFVGKNYFCDSGTTATPEYENPKTYLDNPLWDGAGCGDGSSCCKFNSPPYFRRDDLDVTADDIDVRLCAWFRMQGFVDRNNEDTPLEEIELYIQ